MKVSVSWLREHVHIPEAMSARELAAAFVRIGFEVEGVELRGADVTGPLVVGKVLEIEELAGFKKPIRFCQVDVGAGNGGVRGIVCGARNFVVGDVVVAALPGAVLPGGFQIAARSTYDRVSDGMLCSERELGLGDDHSGIIVLAPGDSSVGADARDLLDLGDAVLDVAVNPDRGYAMSVRGLARELALALDQPFTDPVGGAVEPVEVSEASLATIAADACTRFIALQIDGVNAQAPTPRWMRNRLTACGIRPISLIVDVTNYVMLLTGQPLHAYDRRQVAGALVARLAVGGELLQTLDHQNRVLDARDLVIADDSGPLGLAGVMGGANSEISDATQSVVLEAAHFDAVSIAGTCRRHAISTEASRRFERGVDPTVAEHAARFAARLLEDLAGGAVVARCTQGHAAPHRIVAFDPSAVIARSGLVVDTATLTEVLTRIGGSVTGESSTMHLPMQFTVPSWRPDLTGECDLSEELARVVGYDSIPSVFPKVIAGARLTSLQSLRRRVDDTMASLGWVQVMTSPFMDAHALDAWNVDSNDHRLQAVPLVNPLSDEQPLMRSTLLPGLFAALERNRGRGFESAAVFERSAVHHGMVGSQTAPGVQHRPTAEQLRELDSALPSESHVIAAAAFGDYSMGGAFGPGRMWAWSDASDAALEICRVAGFDARALPDSLAPWHPGRCARIEIKVGDANVTVGFAGEIHPRVVESFRGPRGLIALEVNVDALAAAAATAPWPRMGEALAHSAVVKEDVALVVPIDVTAAAVADALRDGCGPWLEEVRLFDRYAGEQVPPGHVSLAFSLRFRHPERTLRDEEVAALRQQGIDCAAASTGAVLRGGL